MKLTELGAEFVRHLEDGTRRFVVAVDTRFEANGVRFKCPTCLALATAIAPHSVLLWDLSVGVGVTPGPQRWSMHGGGLEDLTLGQAVKVRECGAQFRIVDGEVQPCS